MRPEAFQLFASPEAVAERSHPGSQTVAWSRLGNASDRRFDMTMFRSMRTPIRFVFWLFLALPVALGVASSGYFLPASAIKIYLIMASQIACDLIMAWLFGLIRFRNQSEIGTSILVIIFALAMPAILIVLAIVSTLFCGIDACGS
jgi:hypothetical protein